MTALRKPTGTRPIRPTSYLTAGYPFAIAGIVGIVGARIVGNPMLEVFAYVPIAIWGALLVAFLVADRASTRRERRG